MSIENPENFTPGDAGSGPDKDNKQKQAPEKKKIKIDPNNFDEEEIEKIFKEPETIETKKEKEQTSEENLKDQVEQFLAKQLESDTEFFSKEITPQEFRVWQEQNQSDFIHLPKYKQDALMTTLAN
ncbi:MAG: hypothetical protein ACP5RX_02580, partial [Minisyncoccia bacterium]